VRKGHPAAVASTYRLQLRPDFGFEAAADQAAYLAALGVTHAYLSPILQAAPGSTHGYDVVDHSRISTALGGEAQFRAMAARLAEQGVGVVVDIVPNHMSLPDLAFLNRQLWSVLRDGRHSRYAHWFDVDWAAAGDRMVLPVLPGPPRDCLDDFSVSALPAVAAEAGEPTAGLDDEPVLRFGERVLPLRPGTEALPVRDLLDAQAYRLDSWQAGGTVLGRVEHPPRPPAGLNWRRFLDITSLIAVRVEEPDVFAATHGLLLGLVAEGLIAGLRVDHVDGLADPRGYLRQLAVATGGSWVVAEKVLALDEQLPTDWACAGTTGYDALAAVGSLFADPAGVATLGSQYARLAGAGDFAQVAWAARREISRGELSPEVGRLARLLSHVAVPALTGLGPDDRTFILSELLAATTVYRAYVIPGEHPSDACVRELDEAASLARRHIPRRLHPALDGLAKVLLGKEGEPREAARDRLVTLFQQVCAAVQAKGVEDTAMYRWSRLLAANEVGSDPDRPARTLAQFHAFSARLARDWPATMTTLSTHDTKRQEDVRARLAVLSESPEAWARCVTAWHLRALRLATARMPDPDTEYLLWQTLVGAWPVRGERLTGYLLKAMREAKLSTSWADPDLAYEASVLELARAVLADQELADRIAAFVTLIGPDANANSLGAKLVQLTMPGFPDVYQGCELAGFSLVDPDNRRPVDFNRRHAMLAALESVPAGQQAPARPADTARTAVARSSLDAGKLLVCQRALRLRRDHPDWLAAPYQPLTASGPAAQHAIAFSRGSHVVTVATRLPAGLRRAGGWQGTSLRLPSGRWLDLLTGALHPGAEVPLADLTATLPVALLVQPEDASTVTRAGA
jgi:(1->4)-alpha-D-glucan 1-alpha-D-glucosylmutase